MKAATYQPKTWHIAPLTVAMTAALFISLRLMKALIAALMEAGWNV